MCGRVRSGTLWNALLQSKFNSLQAPQQPSRPKEPQQPQQPQGWMLSFDFCLPIPQLSEKNRIFREELAFCMLFCIMLGMNNAGMAFTTILWDVDGTLLDFEAPEKAAMQSLFLEYGFGECTDEMVKRYSAINRGYWERLEKKELSKPQILVGRFRDFFQEVGVDSSCAEEFNDKYQERLGDTIVFKDDSYEVVKSLQGMVLQYVVSNATILAQSKKLRASGLGELMDGVFLSEQVGFEKPDVRFFDEVLKYIQETDKSRILLVGDSLTSDILGGTNAGIPTCWYNPKGLPAKGAVRIDYEIRDLHEIYDIVKPSMK